MNRKKSKHPDIYQIEKELYSDNVEENNSRIITAIRMKLSHDHDSKVSEWPESVVFSLSSLLLERLLSTSDNEMMDFYPETINLLHSLEMTIKALKNVLENKSAI